MRITSTAICGYDLHLYSKLGLALEEGDILGHEPMGIVEEVGPEVKQIAPGTASSFRSTSPAERASCAVLHP